MAADRTYKERNKMMQRFYVIGNGLLLFILWSRGQVPRPTKS